MNFHANLTEIRHLTYLTVRVEDIGACDLCEGFDEGSRIVVTPGTPFEAIPWAIDLPMISEISTFSFERESSNSFNNSTESVGGSFVRFKLSSSIIK